MIKLPTNYLADDGKVYTLLYKDSEGNYVGVTDVKIFNAETLIADDGTRLTDLVRKPNT